MTCPQCRERGVETPVDPEWDHRGTESYATVTCPVCGWTSTYGPI